MEKIDEIIKDFEELRVQIRITLDRIDQLQDRLNAIEHHIKSTIG